MNKIPYDQVVVTGCSHSCGMEMNDHLLPKFMDENERIIAIWKWGKKHLKLASKNIIEIKEISNKHWLELERKNSWPSLLQKELNIPVKNLSLIGASIGRSLVAYSEYLKNFDKGKRILAIHELPDMSRMYIRFDEQHGRILTRPSHAEGDSSFGFAKDHYKEKLDRVNRIYRKRIMSEGYLEKYYAKVLNRLQALSVGKNIQDYYIFPEENAVPTNDSLDGKILIKDFINFRSNYSEGKLGHIIDPAYNEDICKIITSTCL